MADAVASTSGQALPDPEELVYVLEQQDTMMSTLLEEVKECKEIIDEFREEREKQRKEEGETNAVMSTLQRDLERATQAIDVLKERNSELERELAAAREAAKEQPSLGLLELREKLRKAEFERDRVQRECAGEREEKERLRATVAQVAKDAENAEKKRKEAEEETVARVETMLKESVEAKHRCKAATDALAALKVDSEAARAVSEARLESLEEHVKKITAEHAQMRQSAAVATERVRLLSEDNAKLRKKMLTEQGLQGSPDNKQVQKLLRDQSELIATLKEECVLIAERMEHEQKKYRNSVLSLKKEKKELEDRLERLLKI